MNVIYTGAFRFPDKDAASQRVLSIGKIFRNIGYNVFFFGWEKEARPQDVTPNGGAAYQGFSYFSQNELDHSKSNPFERLYKFIFRGDSTLLSIKEFIRQNQVHYIVAYNANSYFLYKLNKLAKKNKIKVICDCTEWYEADHLPGGKYGLANFDNNFRINTIYPIIKNTIVISSFLERHLCKLACNTIVIPPLIDFKDFKWQFNPSDDKIDKDIIKLIYAGDPGKKDLLGPFFDALELLNRGESAFELILLGSSIDFIKASYFKDQKFLPKYIKVIGKVSMDKVPDYYRRADFSILMREDKRYAHAGFPTKLVESLSSGVPLITNNTSDIKKFIQDGLNGFILDSPSTETIVRCLERIALLSKDERVVMKENARNTAISSFDISQYSAQFSDFLKNLD